MKKDPVLIHDKKGQKRKKREPRAPWMFHSLPTIMKKQKKMKRKKKKKRVNFERISLFDSNRVPTSSELPRRQKNKSGGMSREKTIE